LAFPRRSTVTKVKWYSPSAGARKSNDVWDDGAVWTHSHRPDGPRTNSLIWLTSARDRSSRATGSRRAAFLVKIGGGLWAAADPAPRTRPATVARTQRLSM
jgi:hypothetical protein